MASRSTSSGKATGSSVPAGLVGVPAVVVSSLMAHLVKPAQAGKPVVKCVGLPQGTGVWVHGADQRFWADTVSLALRRGGAEVKQFWHPVFDVARSGKTPTLTLATGARAPSGTVRESVVVAVTQPLTAAQQKVLVAEIEACLHQAYRAVEDFTSMRGALMRSRGVAARAQGVLPQELAFLDWLMADNFVLQGYRCYQYQAPQRATRGAVTVQVAQGTGLGILAEGSAPARTEPLKENGTVIISKTAQRSQVHRDATLDAIAVLERDGVGTVVAEHRFVGLYTSRAYTTHVRDIPLVAQKIETALASTAWPEGSYTYRMLVNVLETWPRDELFLTSATELAAMAGTVAQLHEAPDVCLMFRRSEREQAITVHGYVPMHLYNPQVRPHLFKLLQAECDGTIQDFRLQVGEGELARMLVRLHVDDVSQGNPHAVENALRDFLKGWDVRLQNSLAKTHGPSHGLTLAAAYAGMGNASYREQTRPEQAAADVQVMEQMQATQRTYHVALGVCSTCADHVSVRVYSRSGRLPLNQLMPVLESAGLAPADEASHQLATPYGTVWLHVLQGGMVAGQPAPGAEKIPAAQNMLEAVLSGQLETDSLNSLALTAGLSPQHIGLLRGLTAYLQQIDRRCDPGITRRTLRGMPQTAAQLCGLFDARLNPALTAKQRATRIKPLQTQLENVIRNLPSAEAERIIGTLYAVVCATLRTNFYADFTHGHALALKVESAQVPAMPQPYPWREIFVYHPQVEGIHLRGGPVARGGLRHSDRPTDYRTEVLGLMAAQMRKNTIIVPVGAKGGFYIRTPLPADKQQAAQLVTACYTRFVRALLSVTDTYATGGKPVHPHNVVCPDGYDPYLVVAADKGTARFSDTANAIAQGADFWPGIKGGFWLGDAFASGGSLGYDHKHMAITSRGAWISVEHHLAHLGITPSKTKPITMTGVGDMAGDVFGNGLLRSPYVQLVAAFNHAHVFLDPNPDPAKSYAERQRMFSAGQGWDAYNPKLISQGGGVYPRSAKTIALSPQVQKALGTKLTHATPEQLMSVILKAPVDVFWNGGIGTFIKASDEPHTAAADKAYDDIRIDATQARMKVIGEGGNLGITPRGRVELAQHGVRLNTDALDNSAGVDTSDHEVNLKILLGEAIRTKQLTQAGRNTLLKALTDDVAELVLTDNRLQNQAVSLEEAAPPEDHAELAHGQDILQARGLLDKVIDCLPTADDIRQRPTARYTRPELCALLAGSKAALCADIGSSPMLTHPLVTPLLRDYFPPRIQSRFSKLVMSHPLAPQITATALANLIVNRLGMLFIPRLTTDFSAPTEHALAATWVAMAACNAQGLWQQTDACTTLTAAGRMLALQRIRAVCFHLAGWVLRHGVSKSSTIDLTQWQRRLVEGAMQANALMPKILSNTGKAEVARWQTEWKSQGATPALAQALSLLSPMVVVPDAVAIAADTAQPLPQTLAIHLAVGEQLQFPALIRQIRAMPVADGWTRQAIQAMQQELFMRQGGLTTAILKHHPRTRTPAQVQAWLAQRQPALGRYHSLLADMLKHPTLTVAMLSVLLGRLRQLQG